MKRRKMGISREPLRHGVRTPPKTISRKMDLARHGVPAEVIKDLTPDQVKHFMRKLGLRQYAPKVAARKRRLAPKILRNIQRQENPTWLDKVKSAFRTAHRRLNRRW